MEIAIYGKGGIGKSTVSANLSASLARQGKKVLQIGCDPKHDSTRLLMHGESIPTVLNYLRETEKDQTSLSAVLRTGVFGVGCVEAGGPRPGVGCAGRGIISAFEFLDQHQAKLPYELIVYDVLGDVVCGGFAVPVRREYADAIMLVTSGEYMALYAANNILRGIQNFDRDVFCRVAGILYNERRLPDEDGRVQRFAKAVGLPVLTKIPRSAAFAKAEEQNRTVIELEDAQEEQRIFAALADLVQDGMPLYPAKPLTDEQLEKVVLGSGMAVTSEEVSTNRLDTRIDREEFADKNGAINTGNSIKTTKTSHFPDRLPLYGCAFNGAATTAVHLHDAIIIAHSPRACAFYTWQNISSSGRKNLFRRGVLLPSSIRPHLACTDMDRADVVFGGQDRLESAVRQALTLKSGAVIIVSSCVSGIIGDDIRRMEELSTKATPVIALPMDGDIAGDYMEGIRLCTQRIAERLIDPEVKPEGKRVNLIGETGISNNIEENFRVFEHWMHTLGITINCRYLGYASCREMSQLLRAPLNILAADNADGRGLRTFLTDHYACHFMEGALPIGFAASARWLREIGRIFSCEKEAESLISGQDEQYRRQIQNMRPILAHKRIFLTTINSNMDWLFDTLEDLQMEVVYVGVLNYLHQEVKISDHPERYLIDENFNGDKTAAVIRQYHPDIVLANYLSPAEDVTYLTDSMPMNPMIGFEAGLHFARRWCSLLANQKKGGWMNDRVCFEKYFA